MRRNIEVENRLYTSDYVEARGTLFPAVEYLKRAVEAARTQEKVTGGLLCTVSHVILQLTCAIDIGN